MSMYYIMNAKSIFDNSKATVGECLDTWGNKSQTILVCKRSYGIGNESPIFVAGSGTGYVSKDTKLPLMSWYTEDTGMGHRNAGRMLIIENVIEVTDGRLKPRNNIGLGEKRIPWCMK